MVNYAHPSFFLSFESPICPIAQETTPLLADVDTKNDTVAEIAEEIDLDVGSSDTAEKSLSPNVLEPLSRTFLPYHIQDLYQLQPPSLIQITIPLRFDRALVVICVANVCFVLIQGRRRRHHGVRLLIYVSSASATSTFDGYLPVTQSMRLISISFILGGRFLQHPPQYYREIVVTINWPRTCSC